MSYKQLRDEQQDSLTEPPHYHDIIQGAPKFETVPLTLETVPIPNSSGSDVHDKLETLPRVHVDEAIHDKLSKSNELEKVDIGS